MKTKREILEQRQLLKEDAIENTLMVLGYIPLIGEVFDIALIIYYCARGQYLYAGLMLIALVPTVGDFIAKPIIKLLKGAGGAGKLALKNSDEMVKFANSNPAFKKQYVKLGKELDNPLVTGTINGLSKKSKKFGDELQKSITEHRTALSKLSSRPAGLAKTIGKEVSTGGKFSGGFKKFFQDEKLAKYIARKGVPPKTWVSNWFHTVYLGRRSRRGFIKSFIISNKLLDTLGLPSIGAFEEKMQNDENFRTQVANNSTFSDLVNQTTSPEDLTSIEGGGQTQTKRSGVGDMMSLAFIKMLAKGIA
jgi:hypothetical protein